MRLIGDYAIINALAAAWISVGNLWMMGGLCSELGFHRGFTRRNVSAGNSQKICREYLWNMFILNLQSFGFKHQRIKETISVLWYFTSSYEGNTLQLDQENAY